MKDIRKMLNFINKGQFDDNNIYDYQLDLELNDKRLIRDSFVFLKYLITNYDNNEYDDNLLKNTVELISIMCDKTEFNEDEIIVNRKRIKRARESILAFGNKNKNNKLLEIANKLDEIVLDKNINLDDLIMLIKELIDRKEDVNIIKKLLNTNKGIIIINRNTIFDYVFDKAMDSIIYNDSDIYYYIALLKIFYSTNIDKKKYINILNKKIPSNEFSNELYLLIHGVKRALQPNEIVNKYGILTDLDTDNIILPNKKTVNERIITIDSFNTKLRDDALSIRKDGNNYILGIHIANPGKYIEVDSMIDYQAKNNFKNMYMQHRGTRILPNNLENTFSLNENELKPVLTMYVVFDSSFKIKDYYIKENIIKISDNLAHEQCDSLIDERYKNDLSTILNNLFYLAKDLDSKNKKKKEYWNKKTTGSLDNENISFKSDMIVSELMVLYNSLIATIACDNNIPYIYRTQNNSYILNLANKLDIELDESTKNIINNIYLPSKYSSIPLYHHGLNISTYSHSADPLRRYADLYNQYLLHLFYFKDKEFDFDYDEYLRLIEYANKRSMELSLFKGEYSRALKLEKKGLDTSV